MVVHYDAQPQNARKEAKDARLLANLEAHLPDLRLCTEEQRRAESETWFFITPLGFERFVLPWRGDR